MKSFQKLPPQFQCAEVKEYYDILCKKQGSFVLKRILDIFASVILLAFLIIPIAIIAILVKTDSKGPVFYRQERVTTYGKKFRILKFRTMVTVCVSPMLKVGRSYIFTVFSTPSELFLP